MVSLFYHLEADYSDYDVKYFVYVINQLAEVTERVCPMNFGDARSIFPGFSRKHAKFLRKGLKAPSELFRTARGGYSFHNSLFLSCNNEIEYYWKGDLEEILERILRGGQEYLVGLC